MEHPPNRLLFSPYFIILVLSVFFGQYSGASIRVEETQSAKQRAVDAAAWIEDRLNGLNDRDFYSAEAKRIAGFAGIEFSEEMSYVDVLRMDMRMAFSEIDLARQFPDTGLAGEDLLDLLISGSRVDFFGSSGHIDPDQFAKRVKLLDKLAGDAELRFADRIFSLLQETSQTRAEALSNWLSRARDLVGDNYLGTRGTLSNSQQARTVRTLYLLAVAMQSRHLGEAAAESPEKFNDFTDFVKRDLAEAVKLYCRRRFEEDSALRDRTLPILLAAQKVNPDITHEYTGVTSRENLQRMSLNHARGLANLTRAIDAPMASTRIARHALGQIIDYRVQPFYIGSNEVREKGALPCAIDGELEAILENADFFESNGHRDGNVYRRRVEILEQLFLRPSALETRDHFFALLTPEQWLSYFEETLAGDRSGSKDGVAGEGDGENQNNQEGGASLSCLAAIEQGAIFPCHLKNLFLARCMLSHSSYDESESLKAQKERLLLKILEAAPILAVKHFKNNPRHWNRVDLAFVEVSKLIPEFDLASLSIPTYRQYLNRKEVYDSVLGELPLELLRLSDPNANILIDNETALFQSDYVYRIGKFNKRLSVGFVRDINEKLDIILKYRASQFTPPDRRTRPNMEKIGSPIRELMVVNRNYPYEKPGNPQLHDLIEGPKGGFGGLGALFLADPQGYESRETALDAVASCRKLRLGEALFTLAMDSGIENPTQEDKAAAARRWLSYFRKTQSVARFHSTPDELRKAIRGAFLCRLIVQSDDFIEVVERSSEYGIGSPADVSSVLENTLGSQVRIMNSVLSSVDPSTALNRNIDVIKKRWYQLKAWHTESTKWLEAVVADPVLMSEVSRIRGLNRGPAQSYGEIVPAIASLENTLRAVEPRILAERHAEHSIEMFSPLDFANLIMGQLLTMEKEPVSETVLNSDVETGEALEDTHRELSKSVTRRLFLDVREAVKQAGFEDLSEAASLNEFPALTRARRENSGFKRRSEEAAIHDILLQQLKGAVAKAKGRIEAERITDLRTLEEHSIRAARADRIFFAGDQNRYSLLIDPSLLLHEWNNRHKIETIAEFRTVETRAQAQTQIFRFRKEREKLEQERKEMAVRQEELDTRLEQAKKWSGDHDLEFDPDAVINEMLTMEDKIASLEGEIKSYQEMEEKYRSHHFNLIQQLHQYRLGDALAQREEKARKEVLLAKTSTKKSSSGSRSSSRSGSSSKKTYSSSSSKKTSSKPTSSSSKKKVASSSYSKPRTSYSSSRSSRSSSPSRSYSSRNSSSRSRSSGGSLLQRLFGRNRRR